MIFTGSTVGQIINFDNTLVVNKNTLSLYQLIRNTELATSEILSQGLMNAITLLIPGANGLPPPPITRAKMLTLANMGKQWEFQKLPFKYFFS